MNLQASGLSHSLLRTQPPPMGTFFELLPQPIAATKERHNNTNDRTGCTLLISVLSNGFNSLFVRPTGMPWKFPPSCMHVDLPVGFVITPLKAVAPRMR